MQVHWTNYANTENLCLLQKSIFMFNTSCWILFHDTETGLQITYTADVLNKAAAGDGVRCLAGHESIPIFAFAEMGPSPRLMVKSYPAFGPVTELRNTEAKEYLSLCFSGTDYLVSLTGVNLFALEVWNWRTSQLLTTQETGILSVSQTISCITNNQMCIVQFANNLRQLKLWNQNICFDSATLTEVPMISDKKISIGGYVVVKRNWIVLYDDGGSLFVYSLLKRTVQSLNYKERDILTIAATEEGFLCCKTDAVLWFALDEDAGEDASFVKTRSLSSKWPFLRIVTLENEKCIGMLVTGELGEITASAEVQFSANFSVTWKSKFEAIFEDLLVLVNERNGVEIRKIDDRRLLKVFPKPTDSDITCMVVNASNSCLYLGTTESKVLVFLVLDLELNLLCELFLSDMPIVNIQFSESFLLCSDQSGCHFIVDISTWKILTYVSYAEPLLTRIVVVENDRDTLKLYFFKQSPENRFCCSQLEIFQYNASRNVTTKFPLSLPFPIASVAYIDTRRHFMVNPYLSRELRAISIVQDEGTFQVVSCINWGHRSQTKYFNIHSQGDLVFVYGLDGQISLLEDSDSPAKQVSIGHPMHGEVKGILSCPNSNYVLATDVDNNKVCLKLNSKISRKINAKELPQIPKEVPRACISWLESRQHKNLQSELQNNKQICNEILFQMQILRKSVQDLLNQNEAKPDDERLSIQEFNLNEAHHRLLHQEANSADLDTKRDMVKLIESEKKVQQWLLDNCWHRMDVKSTLVKGIFEDIQTENFSLLHTEREWEQRLTREILKFKIEQLTNSDVFMPFAPINTNKLELILSQEPSCNVWNESVVSARIRPQSSGTTTINFIPARHPRYNQLEVVTYQQCQMEELFGFFDVLHLKKVFNEKFDDLHTQKSHQMSRIREKNERLRVIQRELNELANLCNSRIKYTEEITDPEFTDEENPYRIIQVENGEMTCKPFQAISERTQQSEDCSEEDVPQDMFSAAFRDMCLQTMMDGLLEIRWEDEIKKTPAVPVALQARKDLIDYDEHDLRAVKEYEEKLNFLGQERAKYKKVLMEEKERLEGHLRSIQSTFNRQLTQLIDLRIGVEMAVNQELFKLLRNREFNQKRNDFGDAEKNIKELVQVTKKEMAHLSSSVHEIEKKTAELKAMLENADARDRQLDKQFKNNFAEVSSHAIVDQAYKFFKRRSRWTPKAWATGAVLNDMARRIVNRNLEPTGPPLPEDCFEFLNALEQHDQPMNCPNIMDERMWDMLCKMRRAKIESEFKVRAITAQLTLEAELAEQCLSREVSYRKVRLGALDKEFLQIKDGKQVNMVNRTIQLVVKRGAVEVKLTGRVTDFDDSILIAKSEVDNINQMIRRTGTRKLKAMNNAAIFRRKVLHKQWEHQVLKLRIREMRGFVRIVEKCKITKDVQKWLNKKRRGRPDDVSQVALNKEIDAMVAGYERELAKVEGELNALCTRIQHQKLRNDQLDFEIGSLNLDVNEQQKQHDPDLEEEIVAGQNNRFLAICGRTRLMRKIQNQHGQIVELTALLELQRLRTYPTLNECRFSN